MDARKFPGCVHSLTNLERLWGLFNVAMVVRLVGDVSEEDLRQAISKVLRLHPLTGSKIVFDVHNVAWISTDDVPETMLRIVPRTSDSKWQDEIRHQNLKPFAREIGPRGIGLSPDLW